MTKISCIILTFAMLLVACSQNLPENYGIYAYTDKERVRLEGHKIMLAGNLMESIAGLKGASGTGHKSVKYLIVFEKDINPKSIGLAKLGFVKGSSVQNIFGRTHVEVNLWSAVSNIEFDVAPISGKKDMYKITPKANLTEGFHALHFGGMGRTATLDAMGMSNVAFDFVIGDSDNYQSHEVLKQRNEQKVRTEGENIIKTMNSYFNSQDYPKIKEIYRPHGRIPSDSEWQEFTKGQRTWFDAAGSILNSKIESSNISDEGGVFQVQTVYQKKGEQNERFVIRKIDDRFFIISIE
ncbi:MAG: hypothetical protein NT178_18800 [Proteobacteria bacterium]|nr:hypothetical protein [Pseudomonadota bacterium]